MCLGHGSGRGPGCEAHRLVRIGIEDKEGLGDFGGLGFMVLSMPAHLSLAVTAHAMGIDGQEVTAEMPGSASQHGSGWVRFLVRWVSTGASGGGG